MLVSLCNKKAFNLLWLCLAILILSCHSDNKHSFEGVVTFKTEIATTDRAPANFPEKLREKYGIGMKMYYSRLGQFRRTHLENGNGQVESQHYLNKEGVLIFTHRNSPQVDSVDVATNTLKLVRRERLPDEQIAGYACECYEYDATSPTAGEVVLEFCFSKDSPWVDASFWNTHRDFFLDDYFAFSERPYLRYTLKTSMFKLSMIATDLEAKALAPGMFRWNP